MTKRLQETKDMIKDWVIVIAGFSCFGAIIYLCAQAQSL